MIEPIANDAKFRVACVKCLDTGFVDRVSAIVKPPAMSWPAWEFWRKVLSFSDFCDCKAGRDNKLVFSIESAPPDCSAVGCSKPAVFNLQYASGLPLCEVHEMERKTQQ